MNFKMQKMKNKTQATSLNEPSIFSTAVLGVYKGSFMRSVLTLTPFLHDDPLHAEVQVKLFLLHVQRFFLFFVSQDSSQLSLEGSEGGGSGGLLSFRKVEERKGPQELRCCGGVRPEVQWG